MKKGFKIFVITAFFIGTSESFLSSMSIAQMGSTTTSTGKATVQSIQGNNGIPKIRAKAVEGIQRHTITTGGGFVNQSTLGLPLAPALDAHDKLHDSVKHPYEILPTLHNTRLELIH